MTNRKITLNEDLFLNEGTVEQAAQQLDVDQQNVVSANDSKTRIEKVLDRALKTNLRIHNSGSTEFVNIIFVGPTGSGKTSIIEKWAQENGINLLAKRCASFDPTDFGGAVARSTKGNYVQRLGSKEFDMLERPRSVLFLDEYNRAKSEVRAPLFQLIEDHVVMDPDSPTGDHYYENFLFTIAAINPPTADYNTEWLDDAERARFKSYEVNYIPSEHLDYLNKLFDKQIAGFKAAGDDEAVMEYEGRKAIANTLLSDKRFTYDSSEDTTKGKDSLDYRYSSLSYRSLTRLLEYCDGTKDDFLDNWDSFCNPMKKKMVEDILKTFVDVKDKANAALEGGTKSPVFEKKRRYSDMIKDIADDMGIPY